MLPKQIESNQAGGPVREQFQRMYFVIQFLFLIVHVDPSGLKGLVLRLEPKSLMCGHPSAHILTKTLLLATFQLTKGKLPVNTLPEGTVKINELIFMSKVVHFEIPADDVSRAKKLQRKRRHRSLLRLQRGS
jgi:hypothetical protein